MRCKKSILFIVLVMTLAAPFGVAAQTKQKSATKPDTLSLVRSRLLKGGMSQTEINTFFSDPRLKLLPEKIIKYKQPDWDATYTAILSDISVARGKQFMLDHQQQLADAELKYGVSKEQIVGLLRLETGFGNNKGTYVAANVFYSFVVHWTAKLVKAKAGQKAQLQRKLQEYQDNLVSLLLFSKRQHQDPFGFVGSYAGAVGLPQFLPNSILSYAVDGNGDSIIDLDNYADAIPSVANYLSEKGWKDNNFLALQRYYGSGAEYPTLVLNYAAALKLSK